MSTDTYFKVLSLPRLKSGVPLILTHPSLLCLHCFIKSFQVFTSFTFSFFFTLSLSSIVLLPNMVGVMFCFSFDILPQRRIIIINYKNCNFRLNNIFSDPVKGRQLWTTELFNTVLSTNLSTTEYLYLFILILCFSGFITVQNKCGKMRDFLQPKQVIPSFCVSFAKN